jgi:aryl-alcohol dehydrogenase-like predicted oxidoreductase
MVTDIGTIGFGTTSLLTLGSERERQDLLHVALDAGITHFDTAPYYGYGEAEMILGRFIKDRRDEVTITTKFGIQPPRLAGGGSVAGAVKRLVKNLGPVRKLLARQAGKMVQRAAFGADDAAKSLEASLRALQTDHIDIYLLHEAGPADTSDELLAFLEEKKKQGIIGRFGTGSDFSKVSAMAAAQPAFADVLQFENSVGRPNRRSLAGMTGGSLTITHGALGESFRELHEALQVDVALHRRCSEVLGVDVGDPRHLASAMLSWAVQDNPLGMVLFSSSRPANLRANMEAWRDSRFTSQQLYAFGQLVAAVLPLNEGKHP